MGRDTEGRIKFVASGCLRLFRVYEIRRLCRQRLIIPRQTDQPVTSE
jgi:hypothetical protein